MSNSDQRSDDAIDAVGVCRRFARRWALAGIDLKVARGRSLMVTGANGSGKTTLLRVLATALPPQRGTLRILGQDPWADRATVRPDVALVSHATRLYEDLTASDNLLVWGRLGGFVPDVKTALARVGLDASREEPVRAYSAGMRRRVALAVAMLKTPKLCLLDEPFSALDPDGRAMVGGVIEELRRGGCTMVIATHLPAVAGRYCDSAAHLDAGKVVWTGVPADAPANLEPEPEPGPQVHA